MVLLDMESENYFGLDEVGTSIWQAMQAHSTLKEVFSDLLDQYEELCSTGGFKCLMKEEYLKQNK